MVAKNNRTKLSFRNEKESQALEVHTPVIPVVRRQRQVDPFVLKEIMVC